MSCRFISESWIQEIKPSDRYPIWSVVRLLRTQVIFPTKDGKKQKMLQYYCFEHGRKEEEPWYNRHNFGRIITVIAAFIGAPIVTSFGAALFGISALLIIQPSVILSGDWQIYPWYQILMMLMVIGFLSLIMFILNLLLLLWIELLIGFLLYYHFNEKHIKIACIIWIPFVIYGPQFIGLAVKSIFGEFMRLPCSLATYESFMSLGCWVGNGPILIFSSIAIYILIIIVMIIRCIRDEYNKTKASYDERMSADRRPLLDEEVIEEV